MTETVVWCARSPGSPELSLLRGLEPHGIRDLFRNVHGYEREAISFAAGRRGGGWRLDHVIGSSEFEPVGCDYLGEVREAGLSDHSAVWAELRVTDSA